MKRGDVVVTALPGDFGKPRPAVIVQDTLYCSHSTITVLPMTSDLYEAPIFRITILPAPTNGLKVPSQIMVDKIYTLPAKKMGQVIGHLDEITMATVTRLLAGWLGFA